jgi:hypothetical protein
VTVRNEISIVMPTAFPSELAENISKWVDHEFSATRWFWDCD